MIVGIIMLLNKNKTLKKIETQIQERKDLINNHNYRYSTVYQGNQGTL